MYKRLLKVMSLLGMFMLFFVLNSFEVQGYMYCSKPIHDTEYYDCGNYVYTYYEDPSHSSIIYALNENSSIIYAGNYDGVSVFYANGINYFNRTFDDRSISDNNIWSVLSNRGEVIYDGSFKDSIFVDDSHEGYYRHHLWGDIYTVRQYTSKKGLYRTIAIYNISDSEISFEEAMYNGVIIKDEINEVVDAKEAFSVAINSKYGIRKAQVMINNVLVDSIIKDNKVLIEKNVLNDNLLKGEDNYLSISVTDYLGGMVKKDYHLLRVNNTVSIKLSSLSSVIESSSRRIVIEAVAGQGKSLDSDYSWYYWSNSPDDSLLYDDFLVNYSKNVYKGSYSEGKGVILRNTSGTYYLYALAKDDDSWAIVRSEGYTLSDPGFQVHYMIYDAIFIVTLLIIAVVPVSIYLYVRKKGY